MSVDELHNYLTNLGTAYFGDSFKDDQQKVIFTYHVNNNSAYSEITQETRDFLEQSSSLNFRLKNSYTDLENSSPKIYGGSRADPASHPWLVLIVFEGALILNVCIV